MGGYGGLWGAMGGYGGLMGAFTESFSADTYMRYKIKQERDGATDNDNPLGVYRGL